MAFSSFASNLLDDPIVTDDNGVSDVFLQDRIADEMLLVSSARSGAQGNAASGQPDVSGNGEYVAYQSAASNLIANDTNGAADIFRFDIADGRTIRVSVANNGSQSNGQSGIGGPSMAADGTVVAFQSDATNLVPGDTNGMSDIFVRDLTAGTTRRVSVSSSGAQADGPSYMGAISGNGNFVVFSSRADNLVADDTNGAQDVFIRNLSTGNTTLISTITTGGQGNSDSLNPAVSADGRYIAFVSSATNLIPGDDNYRNDVFLRDRLAGTTILASRSFSDYGVPTGTSFDPAVALLTTDTGDTHVLVAFASNAFDIWDPANPPPYATNQIYEYDATAGGHTSRLSVTDDDQWGIGSSFGTDISADGAFTAFRSTSTNLGQDGGSVYGDVFSHQWVAARTRCQSENRTKPLPLPLPFMPMGPPPEKPDADPDCQDFTTSAPLGRDPDSTLTEPEWYARHRTPDPDPEEDVFPVTVHPTALEMTIVPPDTQGMAYLRNGMTYWAPEAINQRGEPGDWEGWGYRKIAAKHGWGPDVKDQVDMVLANDLKPYKRGLRYRYRLQFQAPHSGAICVRVVVVQYGRRQEQVDKKYPAFYIITTYAYKAIGQGGA